jgi:hypothetical protein
VIFILWEILLPLIIAFAVGLVFGWLIWGWRRTKIKYSEWETMRQKAARAGDVDAPARIQSLESELGQSERRIAALESERDALQRQIDENERSPEVELGTGVLGLSGASSTTEDVPAEEAAGSGDGDQHPYGPGSHAPLADKRAQPEGYTIKGNVDSMLYHRPDSRNYGATIAEVWFDTPESAEANGFTLSPTHPAG